RVAPTAAPRSVLYSGRQHAVLSHRGEPEDAPVDAEVARRAPLPPEVARHRLAHHLLPRFRLTVLVHGAHRGAHDIRRRVVVEQEPGIAVLDRVGQSADPPHEGDVAIAIHTQQCVSERLFHIPLWVVHWRGMTDVTL